MADELTLDYVVEIEDIDLDHPLDLTLEIVGGMVKSHAGLSHLDYATSGHTGFEAEGAASTMGAGKVDKVTIFNDQAGDYTIVAVDKNKHIRMQKATACTLTIADVLVSGESLTIEQNGVGQVTFVAGSGVVIRSAEEALKTRVQYSGVTIIKTSTAGEYQLFGDLVV